MKIREKKKKRKRLHSVLITITINIAMLTSQKMKYNKTQILAGTCTIKG